MTKFSLSPKANLKAGVEITDGLIRFRAELSKFAEGFDLAIAAAMGGNVKVIAKTVRETAKTAGGYLVEGFALARPESLVVETSSLNDELTKRNLRCIASNMYMDADEQVWSVKTVGDTTVITRDGNDDVMALLASANKVAPRGMADFEPIIAGSEVPVAIVYVDKAGEFRKGIAYATVDGEDDQVMVMDGEDPDEEPEMVSTLQVTAAEYFEGLSDEQYEEMDPLTYWRKVYSEDPEMIETLEQYI